MKIELLLQELERDDVLIPDVRTLKVNWEGLPSKGDRIDSDHEERMYVVHAVVWNLERGIPLVYAKAIN